MKIPMIFYKPISKEVEIEFPFYYKSEYLDGNYRSKSYMMVLEDGTQITVYEDSGDTLTWRKDKIAFTNLPIKLFGENNTTFDMKYTIISKKDFLQQYRKFMKEATLND